MMLGNQHIDDNDDDVPYDAHDDRDGGVCNYTCIVV